MDLKTAPNKTLKFIVMNKYIFSLVLLFLSSLLSASDVQHTSYDESHMEVVESGFENLKLKFQKGNNEYKSALLFCLERYVDPYYESKIDYEKELYNWLFVLLNSGEDLNVKGHALDLLIWDSSRDNQECSLSSSGKLFCEESTP